MGGRPVPTLPSTAGLRAAPRPSPVNGATTQPGQRRCPQSYAEPFRAVVHCGGRLYSPASGSVTPAHRRQKARPPHQEYLMKGLVILLICLLAAVTADARAEGKKRPLTVADLFKFQRVSD